MAPSGDVGARRRHEEAGIRLFFDITSTAQWSGAAVGIVRVERELARWARAHRGDVAFTVFDPASRSFRLVRAEWVDRLIAGDGVSLGPMPSPLKSRPRQLLDGALSILKLRRQAVRWLDPVRRRGGPTWLGRAAAALQDRLARPHERARMFGPDGRRRSLVGYRAALGPEAPLGPGAVLASAGYGWLHHDVEALARLKRAQGVRFVLLCYDLIPHLFPAFYEPRDVERFRSYMRAALPAADRLVFNSEAVRNDARRFCRERGAALASSVVLPLGADFANRSRSDGRLPPDLEPGRFALFVSTLEPRKGHAFLLRLWDRLAAEGVPARAGGFKLVFVGRAGWMVEALVAELRDPSRRARGVVWLESVDDGQLHALYGAAAFCLFPSASEGYGLPVVEAFHHGKPVLASTGGALPEVVGPFSPCLSVDDEDAWHRTLGAWILDPQAYAPCAARIRAEFRHPSWDAFCRRFFAAAADPSG